MNAHLHVGEKVVVVGVFQRRHVIVSGMRCVLECSWVPCLFVWHLRLCYLSTDSVIFPQHLCKVHQSETKHQPKRKFSAGRPCGHLAEKFGQALKILGKKKHIRTDMPRGSPQKKFGLTNFGQFFVPSSSKVRGELDFTHTHTLQNVWTWLGPNCTYAFNFFLNPISWPGSCALLSSSHRQRFLYVFLGSFPMGGREKHINKILPNSRDNPVKKSIYVYVSSFVFWLLKLAQITLTLTISIFVNEFQKVSGRPLG